jgi:glycosyltransferase involved in cell wall biosynthesis
VACSNASELPAVLASGVVADTPDVDVGQVGAIAAGEAPATGVARRGRIGDVTARERVSVVIPCYNQAIFLADAIGSAIRQSHSPHEVIVVDDGSTDGTADVAAAFPEVRYVRQDNQGVATARNAGLAHSRGEYLVFLDADDRLLPGALADAVTALQTRPDCAFVYGHVQWIGEDGEEIVTPKQRCCEGDLYLQLLRHNYIWTCGAVLYRRWVFDAVAPFNPRLDGSADFDLHARILRSYPACCHDRLTLAYRRHDGSMSHDAQRMLKAAVTARREQRRLVRGRPAHVAAAQAGIRAVQTYYGDRLAMRVAHDIRERRWSAVAAGCATLLKYDPRGFARRLSKVRP